MDVFTIFSIAGCLLSAGIVYVVLQFRHFEQNQAISNQILKAQTEATVNKKKLQGYTKYADYMEAVKLAVSSGAPSLGAKVVRDYVHVENLPKAQYKLIADAKLIIKYQVEFTFGVDLGANAFEVVDGANGIGVKVKRPTLSVAPTVKPLSHEFISAQSLPDEKQALALAHQNFAEIARHYGTVMATEEAARSICKLKLIEFFRDFLAKQPGVQHVPAIFVDYK
jgi:hypothetical protein